MIFKKNTMLDRIKYGRIAEEGDLTSEKRKEFRKLFFNYGLTQISTTSSFCAFPPNAPYIHEKRNETAKGDNSWKTLESAFEEITETPINKIPLHFRHRKKKGKDCVEIMASCTHSLTGSHHIYTGRVISTK